MFFIPGEIISAISFPGIIVHEAAHMFFCKIRKVAVFEAVFFQFGNPSGYVIHERTDSFLSTFLISMGPFFVNTLLCLIICFPAYMPISFFDIDSPLSYLLIWLGVSIGMHAIPSNQDATNLFDQAKVEVKTLNPLAVLSFPLVILIYIFNVLRIVWADVLYGIAIGIGLPTLYFE